MSAGHSDSIPPVLNPPPRGGRPIKTPENAKNDPIITSGRQGFSGEPPRKAGALVRGAPASRRKRPQLAYRRARGLLGVKSGKRGATWYWLIDGAATPPTKTAKRQDRQAKSATGQHAARHEDVSDLLVSLIARVEHLEALVLPPEPRTTRGHKPGDFRRNRDGLGAPGRWGTRGLVRCADCAFADDIDGDGFCHAADREIRWPYARRSCESFAAFEEADG